MTSPTPDPSELAGLLARVEAATGPDRRIDGELAFMLGEAPEGFAQSDRQGGFFSNGEVAWTRRKEWLAEHYTASLDAALALVERVLPGWAWELTRWSGGGYTTSISQYNPGDEEFRGQGPTPALAIISAFLKALSASAGSGEEEGSSLASRASTTLGAAPASKSDSAEGH